MKNKNSFKKGHKVSRKLRKILSNARIEEYRTGRRKVIHFKKVKIGETNKLRMMFNGKRIYLSHYIWFKYYGYFPKKGQVIHHIDFNGENNDISNLQIMSISEHMKIHWRIR